MTVDSTASRHDFVISKAYISKRREKCAAPVRPVRAWRVRVAYDSRATARREHTERTARAQRVRNEETCATPASNTLSRIFNSS